MSNQWLDLVRQSGASQYADQLTLEKISISALKHHVSVLFRCEEILPWSAMRQIERMLLGRLAEVSASLSVEFRFPGQPGDFAQNFTRHEPYLIPVSYTHLDVYKRQGLYGSRGYHLCQAPGV